MIGKVVAEKKIDPVFGWAPLLSFVAVAVGGSAAFAGWAVFEGTDLASLWHGLVGQHRGFGRSFYTPAPLYAAVAIWCFAIVDVVWNGRVTAGAILRLAFVSCFAFACLQHLPDTFNPLVHGLKDRGAAAALLGVGCPLLWLLLRPNWVLNANPGEAADETEVDVSDGDHVWTQRLPLCFIAALQPLAVYPTPGTQMAIGTIAIVFAAIVLLQDVVRRESRWLPRPALLTPALLLVAVSSLLVRDIHFAARYQQYTALNLPGAYRLRLPAEQVEQKRWLARTLSNTSTTFVFGEHACNSFYFWCRTQPPTALNPTFWPFLLTAQQQQRVIRALESKRDLAVIHQPFAVELPKDSPLLDYLDANFSLHTKRGQWQVWLRRDEDANR
jgi:hypothetical protein